MSSFLQRLGALALERRSGIEPRLPSRFEPMPGADSESPPAVADASSPAPAVPSPAPLPPRSRPPEDSTSDPSTSRPDAVGRPIPVAPSREPRGDAGEARDRAAQRALFVSESEPASNPGPSAASDPRDAIPREARTETRAAMPQRSDPLDPAPKTGQPESPLAITVDPAERRARLEAAVESALDALGLEAPDSDSREPRPAREGGMRPARVEPEGSPMSRTAPAPTPPSPVLHVHIGRIVVHAQPPRPSTPPASAHANEAAPASLERYLARRSRGAA